MTAGNTLSLTAATAFGPRGRSLSLVRSKAGLALADCTSHESVDSSFYSGGMMLSLQPAVARQTHATATMAQVRRCRRRRRRQRNKPANRLVIPLFRGSRRRPGSPLPSIPRKNVRCESGPRAASRVWQRQRHVVHSTAGLLSCSYKLYRRIGWWQLSSDRRNFAYTSGSPPAVLKKLRHGR